MQIGGCLRFLGSNWCSDGDGAADRAGVIPPRNNGDGNPRVATTTPPSADYPPRARSRNRRYLGSFGQAGAGAMLFGAER